MGLNDPDYEDFLGADFMASLSETAGPRLEEELTRPRVEIWPEDDWQRWVSLHEQQRRSILCALPAMKASPYCAVGYH